MRTLRKTALLIDFDNTITCGDVLGSVLENFSPTDRWLEWETAWRDNEISTLECLRLQIGELRVDERTLLEFVRRTPIDPDFVSLQNWARATGTALAIASDNFDVIVRAVLERHAVAAPSIFANVLTFEDGRLVPSFPHRSPSCARCANCKATHFARFAGAHIIYVGDGLSDICPAMRADQVFAKDDLADYLAAQGRPFTAFRNLGDVVRSLSASGQQLLRPVHS